MSPFFKIAGEVGKNNQVMDVSSLEADDNVPGSNDRR